MRALWLVALVCLLIVPEPSEPAQREPDMAGVRLFFGPGDDLSAIDRSMIASARKSIDMAAYILTDRDVVATLSAAAGRGVRVRLYLDEEQVTGRAASDALAVIRSAGIAVRMKPAHAEAMHLKAFQIDGRVLRTGSANFTFSGGRRQDNDLVMIESAKLAAAFAAKFEAMWASVSGEGRS